MWDEEQWERAYADLEKRWEEALAERDRYRQALEGIRDLPIGGGKATMHGEWAHEIVNRALM